MDRFLPERMTPRRHAGFLTLRTVPVVLLLAFCIAAFLAPGFARAEFEQFLVNDDDDPNDPNHDRSGEENRFDPVVIPLDTGGFLLFWIDNSRGSTDIVARAFTGAPAPTEEPWLVNDDLQFQPHRGLRASSPGGGRAAVAWMQGRQGTDEVYARVFASSDGRPAGPNRHVNTDPNTGVQRDPALATDPAGRTLVCWADNRSGRFRIWGQLLDPAGDPIGDNLPLAPDGPDSVQLRPAVASFPNGTWLLAWDEEMDGHPRIRYRILASDASGGSLATEPAPGGSDQEDPAVLVRAGDMLVAWIDDREGSSDLWGQWLLPDGTPDGPNVLLREHQDSSRDADPGLTMQPDGRFALCWFGGIENRQRNLVRFFDADRSPHPELPMSDPDAQVLMGPGCAAPLADGRWVLAWSDDRSFNLQTWFDLADPETGPTGIPVQARFVPGSASQILGDTAFLPDGRAVVVWGDVRNGALNVYKRMLDPTGAPSGRSTIVNSEPVRQRILALDGVDAGLPFAPAVAASGIGTFVVTWAVNAQGGRLTLWGQLFDPEGQEIGSNFMVASQQVAPQFDPRPAMTADGRFAIAWRDDDAQPDGDILVQNFTAAGEKSGPPVNVIDPRRRSSAQQSPAIAATPYDMVVTWIDDRSGNWDVYRERITLNGARIDTANVLVNETDAGARIDQISPAVAADGDHIVIVYEQNPVTEGLIKGRIETLESKSARTQTAEFTVNPSRHPPGFKHPGVVLGSGGTFAVTWWDLEDGVTRVWAQRFDVQGVAIGGPYLLSGDETLGHRVWPNADAAAGRIQYVWTDSRRSKGWDIYARTVSWNFDGDPTPVSLAYWDAEEAPEGIRLRWGVPVSESGAEFRIWRDLRTDGGAAPSADAALLTPYGIRPDPDGACEFVDGAAPEATDLLYYLEMRGGGISEFHGPLAARRSGAQAHWIASPNPFRGEIRFRAPAAGPAALDILDPAGRLVRRLVLSPGATGPLIWDGRDAAGRMLPSGTYLARPEGARATFKLLRIR